MDKFAVFILTHGRPDKVTTYRTLRRCGYTGDIYIIVDNEDKSIEQYRKNFGEQVIVFDKAAIAKTFDEAGIFEDRRAVVYARNASFQIAKDLGLDYFLQLDDDYSQFNYMFDSEFVYQKRLVYRLDNLFHLLLVFYKSIPANTIAIAQGGDFLGGKLGGYSKSIHTKRKVMNSFFCSVGRPFTFVGRINEDVNTYVSEGHRGALMLSIFQVSLNQESTQQNSGGMTELYLDSGTYVKSFYTVMFAPSCVVIRPMRSLHKRLHHNINWNQAVPKIISESHRKPLNA